MISLKNGKKTVKNANHTLTEPIIPSLSYLLDSNSPTAFSSCLFRRARNPKMCRIISYLMT